VHAHVTRSPGNSHPQPKQWPVTPPLSYSSMRMLEIRYELFSVFRTLLLLNVFVNAPCVDVWRSNRGSGNMRGDIRDENIPRPFEKWPIVQTIWKLSKFDQEWDNRSRQPQTGQNFADAVWRGIHPSLTLLFWNFVILWLVELARGVQRILQLLQSCVTL